MYNEGNIEKDKRMNRIWMTGFRSFELGIMGAKDPKKVVIDFALKKVLQQLIADDADWLITGGQLGIEQWSIDAALNLEDQNQKLKVALMTPFNNFGKQWNEANQAKLSQLKAAVDYTAPVSQLDYSGPSQLKNYQRFMLEHTDQAVFFYDDSAEESKARFDYLAAKQFAVDHDYPIRLIDFDRLQDFADELEFR